MLMSVHGTHWVLSGADCIPEAHGWHSPAPGEGLYVLVGHWAHLPESTKKPAGQGVHPVEVMERSTEPFWHG